MDPERERGFVTLDTSLAAVRRTRVRLEGAGGWQVGRWGLGLTLGLEDREHQTIESGLTRRVRGATAGAVVGASRHVGSLELGVYGRFRNRNETIRLTEVTEQTRVYQLEGLRDVRPIDFITGYYRRIEGVGTSAGGSLSGPVAGGTLAAFGELRRLREHATVQEQNDPLEDSWRVTGWAAGLSWRRPLGAQWTLEASGTAEGFNGKADAAFDSTGVFYTAHGGTAEGRVRLRLGAGNWTAAGGLGLRHDSWDAANQAPDVAVRIHSTAPTLQLLAGRRLGAVEMVLSGAVMFYGPDSRIPDPDSRGQAYQRFIASGLDLYALDARPMALAARIGWTVSKGTIVWLSGQTESLSPRANPLTSFSPTGSRRATALEMGVTLGAR